MRHIALVAGVVATLGATIAGAKPGEPVRLKPSSAWNVHYADDSCRLMRQFGEGRQMVILVLDQFEPGEKFRVQLIGDGVRMRELALLEGAIRFAPHEEAMAVTGVRAIVREKPALLVVNDLRIASLPEPQARAHAAALIRGERAELPPIGPARHAAVGSLEVRGLLRDELVLETGPLDKPMGVLDTCSWDTVGDWGLDVAQQKQRTRKPHPKTRPYTWLKSEDYPPDMIRNGSEGIVNFRMMVDETGMPTSCHIQSATRPPGFGDVVCRTAMRRARFEPALDAQGKPIKSYWLTTIRFRLE